MGRFLLGQRRFLSRRHKHTRWLAGEQLETRRLMTADFNAVGDFNNDGLLNSDDIDLISAAVRNESADLSYDLNADGAVDRQDQAAWVTTLRGTYFGDADLNGSFDSGDLVHVFRAGMYEDQIAGNSGWQEGDWNGDGEFDSSDLVAAFRDGGYNAGPRLAISPVPDQEMHRSETLNVNVSYARPVSDFESLSVSSTDDNVQVALQSGDIVVTADPDFVGTSTVDLHGTMDDAEFEQSFQVTVRGSTAETINRVLMVNGTDARDELTISEDQAGQIVVTDGQVALGAFPRSSVSGMQVTAFGGSDRIDASSVTFPTWLYGGRDDDEILGGEQVDRIFGGPGNDSIFGHGAADVLYGDEGVGDRIEGGSGADFISQSPNVVTEDISREDVDVESFGYYDREYFELVNRYRDAFGFVINHDDGGSPADINDGMIFTGIGLATTALHGDSATSLELIQTLREQVFAEFGGRTRMIRHPASFDYLKSGDVYVRERNQPVSKDGLIGAMTGLYYAYTVSGLDDAVKSAARDTMETYINYLVANDWKTVDRYPDHYIEQDGDDFANVFSAGGGTVSWKGPDAYALSPTDMYALQNTAAEMGFFTSGWEPWSYFQSTIVQVLGDAADATIRDAGEQVAAAIGDYVDQHILAHTSIHKDYSFHVIPGLDWTLIEDSLDFEISAADRENISSVIESIITTTFNSIGAVIDVGTDIPSILDRFEALPTRLAEAIFDVVPDWIPIDGFRDGLTDALQQVTPWLTGGVLGEMFAFASAFEMAKQDEIVTHLTFWPTLLMYETRPEMADLLSPLVTNLDGSLNGRMNMLLFDWLDGDQANVDAWLQGFETNESDAYSNLAYAWKKPASENSENIANGPNLNASHNRLDYLVLSQLDAHGVPDSVTDTIGSWISHWSDVLSDVGESIEQTWIDLRNDLGEFALKLRDEFGASLSQIVSGLTSLGAGIVDVASVLSSSLGATMTQIAGELWNAGSSIPQITNALWNGVSRSVTDIAEAVWDGISPSTLSDIATSLWNETSANLTQIASALWNGAQHSISGITEALWDIGPSTRTGIAEALWDGIGPSTLSDIAQALWTQTSASLTQVASALWSGARRSITGITEALWDIGPSTRTGIAEALWDGIGPSTLTDIAHALWTETSASLTQVASALWNGASESLTGIASALWSGIGPSTRAGIAGALWHGIGPSTLSGIAGALWNGIGGGLDDVTGALWNGIGGLNLAHVASAVWNGIGGLGLENVAWGIWNGIGGIGLDDVVWGLWNGISGLNAANVAWALWNGIGGLGIENVAWGIWNGIGGIGIDDVAWGLWNGISGLNAGNVAWALWNGISGLSTGNVVYALIHGVGVSTATAWSIVSGL